MKLYLKQHQSPGDILMMTSAVRDLKKNHPYYSINVQTTSQELWDNNPYLDRGINKDNADRVIDMHYPLINQSTQGQCHFIHGFRMYLEEQLGIRIPTGEFRCDVHLSQKEREDQRDKFGIPKDKPYWIVDAGIKKDFTAKFWGTSHFQEVIDRTKDRICWVQIGAKEHLHKPLENIVNLLGKTSTRELVSLMYRADGVLTPVSFPMHLSRMQWFNHPDSESRPCVVVAGAREPSVWEAYTCHRYLHNCGILDCCKSGACWKSRTVRLNDGDSKDQSLCLHPVRLEDGEWIPRCMEMISVEEVVKNIGLYLENH